MQQTNKEFYDSYFNSSDYEVFRYDVGSYCTRKIIIKQIKNKTGRLLEIGTGISSMLEDLQHFECHGLDISAETIAQVSKKFSEKKISATLHVTNAEQLPFPDNHFDTIVSAHTFEHIERDDNAFKECARVLKPGGELIIFVPGRLDGTATYDEWQRLGHYRSYNRQRFDLLTQAASPLLKQTNLIYPHKIHNLVWNRLKHTFRWANYPIKKWILRDNKSYEFRPTYKKILLPLVSTTLDSLDKITQKSEKNLMGIEFNVLARYEKVGYGG